MFIHGHLTTADIHAASRPDHTSVKEDHVRGSASNIQVRNDNAVVLRIFPGAASLSRDHGFQIRTRRRYDEISGKHTELIEDHGGILFSR